MLDPWIILQIDWKSNVASSPLQPTKLYFHIYSAWTSFWGKGRKPVQKLQSYPVATVEQACNNVHLRALYVWADFGGDHSINWGGRTLQGD